MLVELGAIMGYLHSSFSSLLGALIFIRDCLHIYEESKGSPRYLCWNCPPGISFQQMRKYHCFSSWSLLSLCLLLHSFHICLVSESLIISAGCFDWDRACCEVLRCCCLYRLAIFDVWVDCTIKRLVSIRDSLVQIVRPLWDAFADRAIYCNIGFYSWLQGYPQ